MLVYDSSNCCSSQTHRSPSRYSPPLPCPQVGRRYGRKRRDCTYTSVHSYRTPSRSNGKEVFSQALLVWIAWSPTRMDCLISERTESRSGRHCEPAVQAIPLQDADLPSLGPRGYFGSLHLKLHSFFPLGGLQTGPVRSHSKRLCYRCLHRQRHCQVIYSPRREESSVVAILPRSDWVAGSLCQKLA